MRANTGPPRPRTQSTPPTTSTRARSLPAALAGTAYATSAAVTIANGTLTRNTHRQLALVTSQPPASGPMTKAMPVQAVQDPIAAPRASPVNVVAITASPAGVRIAPSAPCNPRAMIRVVPSGAAAQRMDVMPKPTIPIRNMRLAPKRSPREPPTRRSEPSVSRYASTTHCWSASPPPRSSSIAGSATFTTVESTKTMTEPRMQATSTSRLRRVRSGCAMLNSSCLHGCRRSCVRQNARQSPGIPSRGDSHVSRPPA